MIKLIILSISIICWANLNAQLSNFNPTLWNLTYSDEFNGPINSEWKYLAPQQPWGTQTFSSDTKYVSITNDGTRTYLDLKAYVENVGGTLTNVSGGIHIPDKIYDYTIYQDIMNPDNNFYYGYYEIESKITKGNQNSANNGLWPAFWFTHGLSDTINDYYWYEEVDIFEPGACYVKDSRDVVHFWTLENSSYPNDPQTNNNIWFGEGYEGERIVDMYGWHKYGLLWLPDRLVFYYDDIPFHSCMLRVPSHNKPALFIDLQTDALCPNPMSYANQFVGSFQINYFRYYTPKTCSAPITEIMGNNYNFSGWVNSTNNIKPFCIFKNTSIPLSSIVQIYSEEVLLINNFEVPVGSSFEVNLAFCD